MRLHVLSDLHLEFGPFRAPETPADAVVLAGDIGSGAQGLRWAIETFRGPVIYVLGNHAFYGNDLDIVDEIKREATGSNVHVLERDAIVDDGVRFLGCTLWTDFGLFGPDRCDDTMKLASAMIRDFQVITEHGQPFTAKRSRVEHLAARSWLGNALNDETSVLPTVVITHHAPYPSSLPSRFRNDPLSAAFVSNIEELMGRHRSVDSWSHACVLRLHGGWYSHRLQCERLPCARSPGTQREPEVRSRLHGRGRRAMIARRGSRGRSPP